MIALRDRKIMVSSVCALFSKGSGAILQILALPLVIRHLGAERYGIVALVGSVLSMVTFAQFGLGGFLTQQIATKKDSEAASVRKIVWMSFALSLSIAAIISVLLYATEAVWGLTWLWGVAYEQNRHILSWGYKYAIGIGASYAVLSLVNGIFSGFQEVYVTNLVAAFSSLFAALALFVLASLGCVTEESVWLVLYGVPVVALILSWIHLLKRHPDLRPRIRDFDIKIVPMLIFSGGGYSIIQTLLPFLQREGTRVALAHGGHLDDVGILSVFFQLSTILGGVLGMVTQPLFAAIADAHAKSEGEWIRKRFRWALILCGILSCCTLVGAYAFGQLGLSYWLGDAFAIERPLLLSYALYFSVTCFAHICHVFLLGVGRMRALLYIVIIQSLMLVLVLFGLEVHDVKTVLWLLIAVELFAGIPFTFPILNKAIHGL